MLLLLLLPDGSHLAPQAPQLLHQGRHMGQLLVRLSGGEHVHPAWLSSSWQWLSWNRHKQAQHGCLHHYTE
jgi:hypothetical protein